MSLLEDIFLQDEADEARELERVIEGDNVDERPRSPEDSDENSEKEDEAEEDKRRVDPTKTKATRVVKNPRFVLNPARLTGPRGIQVIPEHFKDFKFKGKGHEKDDLDFILKKLEHWAYRLYPKFQFEDCLKKIETLGKKRQVMVHLHKIRSNQYQSDEIVVQKDSSDDEAPQPQEDEFDKLLQQQIELARATPAPGSARKGFETPSLDKRTPFAMPKATSSPSINDEQRERMLKNRRLAEERRLARLKTTTDGTNTSKSIDNVIIEENTSENVDKPVNNVITDENIHKNSDDNDLDGVVAKRHNKTNVIDSSDSEDDMAINESVNVDVHNDSNKNDKEYISNEQNDVFDKVCQEDIARKRLNKSNIIDSSDSDEDITNTEPVIVDINVKTINNKEDLTNKQNDAFDKVIEGEIIITRNKSNVIDSSDSDDEMTITEPVTIDIHNESGKKNKRNDKAIIINKENDISIEDDDNNVIDITENVSNAKIKRQKKSNVIDDSSDDEMVITEAITLDNDNGKIYQNNDKINHEIEQTGTNEIVDITDYKNTSKSNITKENKTINLTDSDTLVKHNNFKENELIDITLNDQNIDLSEEDAKSNSNNLIDIDELSNDIQTDNMNEKDINRTQDLKAKEQNGTNNSNIDPEVEEVMDIDFTDEF